MTKTTGFALFVLLIASIACSGPVGDTASTGPDRVVPKSDASGAEDVSAQDRWWGHLHALCGTAFAGRLVSSDEADADLAGQPMVMHVRRCEDDRLEIPFHIGDNRSRTWVLTRTMGGVQLQHDHRHEDGSADAVTLYGGHTADAGTEIAQHFPVDSYSIGLFETNGLSASVVNVWTMEVVPGERFSYILRRPGRHFQADFDLSQPIDPPPAPWGHESPIHE